MRLGLWRRMARRRVLLALARGDVVKGHRWLNGRKAWLCHPLDGGPAWTVAERDLRWLQARGYLHSNHKFPAASYMLTDAGRALAEALTGEPVIALGTRLEE